MTAAIRSDSMRVTVSAAAARQIIDAAVVEAEAMAAPITVAVVDESGVLKQFGRMDGAAMVSVQTALNKAYAAAAIGMPLLGTNASSGRA